MTGTPVVLEAMAATSGMQKHAAIRKMKPVTKPMYTAMTIARGACFLASLTSSVMRLALS
jgi:hypothetical protein